MTRRAVGLGPDRRDGRAYVATHDLDLAVEVALATGRPLLLSGNAGSGKSSLAAHVAFSRQWRYVEHVVTSRTQTQDLLWTFDPVRRFADAQFHAGQHRPPALDDFRYVTPGVLWWAFDQESARRRGSPHEEFLPADEPLTSVQADHPQESVVVLIDEIDKADPDLPNGLLVPLGSAEFTVTETGTRVCAAPGLLPEHCLVVITTNGERALPQAFLRRCVTLELPRPDVTRLVAIAVQHLNTYIYADEDACSPEDEALARALAEKVEEVAVLATGAGVRPPSTAEYLDALNACRSLGIRVGDERWKALTRMTIDKGPAPLLMQ